jgi:hypothetical protein
MKATKENLSKLYIKFFNLHKQEVKSTSNTKTKYINVLNRICKLVNKIGYEILEKNFYFMVDRREKAKLIIK